MNALRDVLPQLLNGNDFEVQAIRGQRWDKRTKDDFELRKRQACSMIWERENEPRPRNTVFKIAQVCKLSVMTVRDIEKEYLQGSLICPP